MERIPSVRAVMTPFPYCVDVDDSVLQARALMVRHRVRHLPVKDHDVLVGVLTDRDIKRALDPDLGLPAKDELFVRDVFVPDAYIVDAGEALDNVLDGMASRHVGSALVTMHGRLAGIFTMTDACLVFCKHLRAMFPAQADGDRVA
jgi:acetoin utilization protein AcuB